MAVDKSRVGGLWLIYGIPGTGKTILGALNDGIIPAVKAGRTVFTNVDGLSAAGVTALADVPPLNCDIRFLSDIKDVIAAFDLPDCSNCLFVLDEMKQFIATDDNAVDWLCQRLNIMRKRSNDFIMIAQLEDYFPKEVRKLARGCSLYKRLYGWGSKGKTQEFRFDGGNIIIKNGDLKPNGISIRRIPKEIFTCYQSGIDGLIGIEDEGRKNSVWASPKAIVGYLFVFFVLCMLIFGVLMFFNIKGSVGEMSDAITGASSVPGTLEQINKKVVEDEKKKPCFTRKVCTAEICKTDAGEFPATSWVSDFNGFATPAGLVQLCAPGE